MSHAAIAAALALQEVSAGERLVAFSLASYANREQRAFPGTTAAAARSGVTRGRYLAARGGLVQRGLVTVEGSGAGRGNSPTILLDFARAGPWLDAEVNAPLFEAVLSHSQTRGSARLLIAALAALADDTLTVADVTTELLCAAAGLSNSTYRRARTTLLTSGEVALRHAGGGRAKTNRWALGKPGPHDPAAGTPARRRVPAPRNARPLLAEIAPPAADVRPVHAAGGAGHENRPGRARYRPQTPVRTGRLVAERVLHRVGYWR